MNGTASSIAVTAICVSIGLSAWSTNSKIGMLETHLGARMATLETQLWARLDTVERDIRELRKNVLDLRNSVQSLLIQDTSQREKEE